MLCFCKRTNREEEKRLEILKQLSQVFAQVTYACVVSELGDILTECIYKTLTLHEREDFVALVAAFHRTTAQFLSSLQVDSSTKFRIIGKTYWIAFYVVNDHYSLLLYGSNIDSETEELDDVGVFEIVEKLTAHLPVYREEY